MAEQEENKDKNTAANEAQQAGAGNNAQDNADEARQERADEAKHERQQPNENKRNIIVEFTGKYYIVKSEGGSSALYESEDKDASLDFANKVADEHNVKVILDERIHEEKKDEGQSGREGARSERRRYDEGRENEEGPRKVIIEDDGRYYIVRNDGDRAKLYESEHRDASLDFARKVAKDHEVDLVMLDRDRYVVLEEQYSNSREEKNKQETSGNDKGADKQ